MIETRLAPRVRSPSTSAPALVTTGTSRPFPAATPRRRRSDSR